MAQVGDGTTTVRLAPVTVKGLAGAAQVVVGRYSACARLDDGTVSCWGVLPSGPDDGHRGRLIAGHQRREGGQSYP